MIELPNQNKATRPYQNQAHYEIFKAWNEENWQSLFLVMATGSGKCLGKGTPIIMFDGTTKKVEDIKSGELLIGPDSEKRTVLSICKGKEMLYKVTPVKGEPYIVNESHILSLKRTSRGSGAANRSTKLDGSIVNISVKDYLNQSDTFKHIHKGYRTPLTFEKHQERLEIDPYYLGLWLGDGHSHATTITTGDPEIKSYLIELAYRYSCKYTERFNSENSICATLTSLTTNKNENHVLNALKYYNVHKNKHVPHRFKTGTFKERIELLAGLLDADGHSKLGFDLTLKSEVLIDDIIFIARSLGFSCYKSKKTKTCTNTNSTGTYYSCSINGDIHLIPTKITRKQALPRRQKKNVLVTGIKVEPIGEGDYYGFTIDGDHLFVLGDFTVTHNTFTAVEIVKEFIFDGKRVMWIAHRQELIDQAWQTMYDHQIYAGIIMNTKKTNYELPVQVCSIQTIARRVDLPPADLIVIDEAHHVSKESQYKKIVDLYPDAKVLMLSATPYRLSGAGFADVFGPDKPTKPIIAATMHSLINQGWLCPFDYYICSVPDLSNVKITSTGDYEEDDSRKAMEMAPIVESWIEHAKNKIGITFAINVAHSKEITEKYNQRGIPAVHVDGTTDAHTRKKIFDDFRAGFTKVLVNCGITTEGTDLPICEFVQHARPTTSLSLASQMNGRPSRALPGIVDKYELVAERRKAIAESGKPMAIILDNAGIAFKHMMPDHNHNWLRYFNGTKGEKKRESAAMIDEQLEMLVFVAEDEKGNQFRTNKAKEIEGLKLIRVDSEVKRKIVNIVAIKKFDEEYAKHKNNIKISKPGYVAVENYLKYCDQTQTFIPPEVWDYLEAKLITNHLSEVTRLENEWNALLLKNGQYQIPDHVLKKGQINHDAEVKKVKSRSVSRRYFAEKKKAYLKDNVNQVAEYVCKKLNLTLPNNS